TNVVRGPVRGGTIDNNNLIGRARTQEKRFQAARRDVLSIPVQDDDAELDGMSRRVGRAHCGILRGERRHLNDARRPCAQALQGPVHSPGNRGPGADDVPVPALIIVLTPAVLSLANPDRSLTDNRQEHGHSASDCVALDCWYVRNWSLWYDLVILLKTVRVVLRRQEAY